MHDCYIASGWFNENQARDLENIKSALDELGVNYFSPKDEIVAKPDASPEEQEMIFKGNVDAITGGDFVVCNTRDKDLGTIFEAGFSYASNVPIIYNAEGLQGGVLTTTNGGEPCGSAVTPRNGDLSLKHNCRCRRLLT